MRFAHLSDSHLGYRQFGLLERENDFYDVFARNIDKIIEKDVDFIIHSGDLFENARPSTEALLAFQKALLRLKEEKISIYAIAGNHDSVLRKGALPPQVLFKDLGLKLISPDNPAYVEGAVLICGIPYVASSQKRALISAYNNLSKLADKYLKSILVSHQGIDKWMYKDSHEVELAEMPKNFDYYAMGHIHNYIEEDFGKGKLVYPGSMEIWKTSESNDNFREHGKGFVVVDLSHDRPELERVKIKMPREFYQEVIDYNKFSQRIHLLKEKIQSLDKQAMLDLTVVGGDFNSADVYELIQEAIGEDVLNLRPNFKPDKVLEEERIIDENKILDPRALLQKKLNERYGRDEINKLSIDLLDNLSVGRVDDAKIISNRFYSEHYYNGENLSNNLNYSEDYYNGENLSNNLNYSEDSYNGENLSNNLNDSTKEYKLNIEDKSSEKDSNNDKLKNKEISLDDFQ
ncbi:metallophosphoesterase family protein [Methanobrevibacter olleyae]|uniref:DNA double-strand break repair protein Mre11 n=1 Tax=Methanobrevibacter olleyae TaxID=294671 RepID=A0A126R039_METOL|nr:DNA repair exonuclease [Methanobrevibacter olleyae]AMK15319.1 DNA double-strand break repair protein Mre11 [Methanobrevibacter olleyae]